MDIIFTADWQSYMKEVSENLLTPLNDDKDPNGNLFKLYGAGILSSLNPAFITGSQVDGVSYAIPTAGATGWASVRGVEAAFQVHNRLRRAAP